MLMKSGKNQEPMGNALCEIAKGIDIAQQGRMFYFLQLQRFAFDGTFRPKNQILLMSYFAKDSLANVFSHHTTIDPSACGVIRPLPFRFSQLICVALSEMPRRPRRIVYHYLVLSKSSAIQALALTRSRQSHRTGGLGLFADFSRAKLT